MAANPDDCAPGAHRVCVPRPNAVKSTLTVTPVFAGHGPAVPASVAVAVVAAVSVAFDDVLVEAGQLRTGTSALGVLAAIGNGRSAWAGTACTVANRFGVRLPG